MNGRGIPPAALRAAESIETATRKIVQAAEALDAGAIREAVEERGRCVESLCEELHRHAGECDPSDRKRLLEAIALQAHDAYAGLRSVQESARDGLITARDNGRGVRGYGGGTPTPSALDRSS